MNKILIDAIYPQEIRVAKIAKDNRVLNFDYESSAKKQLKGNIYLAKVTRVEPSLQAAFVEYGENKHGFLPFAEIHTDYYQIPAEDKKKLEQEEDADNEEQENEKEQKQKDAKGKKSGGNSRLKKIAKTAESDDCAEEGEALLKKRKARLTEQYKIQEVIKKNQLILVQVIKEERGNKGVSLSTYISLAGRYCVLMPNSGSRSGGISRRIDNVSDRKRLRELVKGFNMPKGTSIILRTAVMDKRDDDIKKDYNYLVTLWNNIRQDTLSSSAPALVYQEADVIKRCIRDLYDTKVEEIVVEGDDAIARTKRLMKAINSSSVKKIKEHKSKAAIFHHYKIEDAINQFYSTTASLESGGYLVINITEALVSIDVNSGRATKERSVEETALKTNLEAAREVARQMHLRDLSGLIVVDFIDMLEVENRKALERELRKSFENDKARIQISRVSNFGLVEMSRQRLKPSLIETNTIPCPHCNGTGYVKSYDSLAVDIFRAIRHEVLQRNVKVVKVYGSPNTMSYVMNFRRNNVAALEKENGINVFLYVNNACSDSDFKVETTKNISNEDKDQLEHDKAYSINPLRLKDYKEGKGGKQSANANNSEYNFVKKILKKLSS